MKRRDFLSSIAIVPFAKEPIIDNILAQEMALPGRRISLRELHLLDSTQSIELGVSSRLIVLHIWGDHCAPCIAEMPEWRRIVAQLAMVPDIRFVAAAETYSLTRLKQFLQTKAEQLPQTKQYILPYGDRGGSENSHLRAQLDNLAQPITLLLDRQLVVRQAFVGSIKERVLELQDSVGRLLAAVRGKPVGLEVLLPDVAELATQTSSGQVGIRIARRTAELAMLHRRFSAQGLAAPQLVFVNPPGGTIAQDEKWIRSLEKMPAFSKIRFLYSMWAYPLHAMLLLDGQQIVRQAFLGELRSTRTSEVLLAIERFARVA